MPLILMKKSGLSCLARTCQLLYKPETLVSPFFAGIIKIIEKHRL